MTLKLDNHFPEKFSRPYDLQQDLWFGAFWGLPKAHSYNRLSFSLLHLFFLLRIFPFSK